jgi:hypothetical protein
VMVEITAPFRFYRTIRVPILCRLVLKNFLFFLIFFFVFFFTHISIFLSSFPTPTPTLTVTLTLTLTLTVTLLAYFGKLKGSMMVTYFLYFGYMGIISVGIFLITGTVGFFSALYFNYQIYASIKVD